MPYEYEKLYYDPNEREIPNTNCGYCKDLLWLKDEISTLERDVLRGPMMKNGKIKTLTRLASLQENLTIYFRHNCVKYFQYPSSDGFS